MNKIRKERQSERMWKQKERELSRAYAARMQREKKEKEAKESEEKRTGYPAEGQLKESPVRR